MTFLPNILSMSRFFLAFFLFSSIPSVRLLAIFIAALTDFLDGALARKWKCISPFGRVIDPLSDKFFVLIGLYIFTQEGVLTLTEALLMLSRDGAILIFMLLLFTQGRLKDYPVREIFCGKVTTTLQFIAFFFLSLGISLSFSLYILFGLLGILTLFELYIPRIRES